MPQLPDISHYKLHKTIVDIDLDGVVVPGLTGRFFQRREGGSTATAGLYSLAGQELFLSWGYRHEPHCAWTSYRFAEGWTAPHAGCPRIRTAGDALILDAGVTEIRLNSPQPLSGG